MRIINNTDLAIERLLVLYAKELRTVRFKAVESVVFDSCRMTVYGIDCVLLEIND
jgi:hypothetical protein